MNVSVKFLNVFKCKWRVNLTTKSGQKLVTSAVMVKRIEIFYYKLLGMLIINEL